MVKLVECPRDALQGLKNFVPTELKLRYLNKLLEVGFHTLDFGSFVSPKAIPQLSDTHEIVKKLTVGQSNTRLLAIVANQRGARDASSYEQIGFLGYPFSVSETFQLRNTNATIEESLERVATIQDICVSANKELVVYLSMGFGNPYGDPWNVEIVQKWVEKLSAMGIGIMALSDTIGVANPDSIHYLFSNLIPSYPDIEFGAHFHTQPTKWREKVKSAYESGCRRFDGALSGFGGCPMARDELTGNMPTEKIIQFLNEQGRAPGIDNQALLEAMQIAQEIFPVYDE